MNSKHFLITSDADSNLKIAITQFTFKNAPLLKLLKQRGTYIKNNDRKSLR